MQTRTICSNLLRSKENNRSRWNNFRIIYGDYYHLYFRYTVIVHSEKLGIYGLKKDQLERLQLIHYLAETGMTVSQVSATSI